MIQTLTHLFNCGLLGVSCGGPHYGPNCPKGTTGENQEGFQGMGLNQTYNGALPMLLAIVVVLLLQLFIGKWLWNSFLVPAVSVVNPLKSIWDILAISILARLLVG